MLNLTLPLAIGLPQGSEWVIIAAIALLFFGGERFPALMRSLGKGISEFQGTVDESKRALNNALNSTDDDSSTPNQNRPRADQIDPGRRL